MYVEDVFIQASRQFSNYGDSKTQNLIEVMRSPHLYEEEFDAIAAKSLMPIGVYPNRTTNRMIAQSSTFTLHGGKLIYGRDIVSNDDIVASERNYKGHQFTN